MKRRSAGTLVLAAALLAAVAIPHILTTRIGGTAAIAPVAPGPPSVGDCLLQPVWINDQQPPYPHVTTRACTGQRFGEVVGLIPASEVEQAGRSTAAGSITDPNLQTCQDEAAHFLGTTTDAQFPASGGWSMFPTATLISVAGPDTTQEAAGQHWLACIEHIDFQGPGNPLPADYRRTAKNAFTTGPPPAAFATCLRTATMEQFQVVDCHQPHQAELFGITFGPATSSMSALAQTCTALVSRYTQIPKAGATTKLAVSVIAFDTTGKLMPAGANGHSLYEATCIVAAAHGHQLNGPLMGLGNSSLPLK